MSTIWEAAERAVAYDGEGAGASGPDQPEAAR
jgi:hypothetical protein